MSTRWRPIASAPRDGTRILILEHLNGGEAIVDIARFVVEEHDTAHQWQNDAGVCYLPRLWMPLPPANGSP
jgi:hypothetical protein